MAPLNMRWRPQSLIFKLVEAAIVSLVVSSVAYGLPVIAGTCYPKPVIIALNVTYERPPTDPSGLPVIEKLYCKTGLEATTYDNSGGTYIHPTPPELNIRNISAVTNPILTKF